MEMRQSDVIVIGSGMAGLVAALSLAPLKVTLLTKTGDLPGGSSNWAQGGIAAAIDPEDNPADHAADTVVAGAGLTDPEVAALLTAEGARRLARWIHRGLPFDRDADGQLLMAREAAHGAARVLHAGGDATGHTLMQDLSARVRAADHISVETGAFAWDLVTGRHGMAGVLAHHADAGWVFHRAGSVLLASGGIGQLYRHTTNPAESTGDGLALAARAGADLADLEFVQFHPTALAVANRTGQVPLLTEALRGAGALLLDENGQRFMLKAHPLAELAPRDVVAKAIGARIAAGLPVFLDLRAIWAAGGAEKFPTVAGICTAARLDPAVTPIPVAPAAHYHMGGVVTDHDGRTSIKGLYAAGEVACTGVHGANRLASNSLLEALVFAERAAEAILANPAGPVGPVGLPNVPRGATPPAQAALVAVQAADIMAESVGLLRDGVGLSCAIAELEALQAGLVPDLSVTGHNNVRLSGEVRNRLLVSLLVARSALARQESRGAHQRSDWPESLEDWRFRQRVTLSGPAVPPRIRVAPPRSPLPVM